MKFLSFISHLCRHLALQDDHTTLEIREFSHTHLTLGTNGCGKSSIHELLFFSVPTIKDYYPGGYQIHRLEHEGKHYVLQSNFAQGSAKYEFWVDGVNLNKGLNYQAQVQLVQKEFKLDDGLRSILLGKTRFSEMSPAQRRELFIRISGVDLSYAMKIFDATREKARDHQGAMKLVKQELAKARVDLPDHAEIAQAKEHIQAFKSAITTLLAQRQPIVSPPASYDAQRQDQRLRQRAKSYIDVIQQIDVDLYAQDTQTLEITKSQELSVTNANILTLNEQLLALINKRDILQLAANESMGQLSSHVAELDAQIASKEQTLLPDVIWNPDYSVETVSAAFQASKPEIEQILLSLPVNNDRQYSIEAERVATQELNVLESKIGSAERHLATLSADLAHQVSHRTQPDAKCPQCEHSFSTRYNESIEQRLKKEIDKTNAAVTQLLKQREAVKDKIDKCREYGQLWRQLITCVRASQAAQAYWDLILADPRLRSDPQSLVGCLNGFVLDLNERLAIYVLQQQRMAKIELREKLTQVGTNDSLAYILEQISELEQKLVSLTTQKQQLITEHKRIAKHNEMLDTLSMLENNFFNALDESTELYHQSVISCETYLYDSAIDGLNVELAERSQRLNALENKVKHINDLEARVAEHEVNAQAYQTLCDILSPVNGLIAQTLVSCIESFIDAMNEFISNVWTYELKVLPCKMDFDGDRPTGLDFKFPLQRGLKANLDPASDVKQGSTAMVDIVDLAFVITLMNALGYSDWPLFVDEFGQNFDPSHRQSAVGAISTLVKSREFSHVFIISQFNEIFSALAHANILLINSTNVIVPRTNGIRIGEHCHIHTSQKTLQDWSQ